MTPTQVSTLLSLLAGAVGLVLELLGVPVAGLVAGLVAGALGIPRPGDVRAGKPAPGSMDAEVEKILAGPDGGVLR